MSPVNFLDAAEGCVREFGTYQDLVLHNNIGAVWAVWLSSEAVQRLVGSDSGSDSEIQPAPICFPRRPHQPDHLPPQN